MENISFLSDQVTVKNNLTVKHKVRSKNAFTLNSTSELYRDNL
jgi:hypothetical protein